MEDTIQFYNTPQFYLAYTANWLVKKKKEKASPAEIAIVEDLHKLVKVAINALEPGPAEPEIKN